MWKNIILAISLALNVFVLGAAGYGAWHLDSWTRGGERGITHALERVEKRALRHLEGEDKAAAKTIIDAHRPRVESALKELRKARRDARNALTQTPTDKAALNAALARSQNATDTLNIEIHNGLNELVRDISPEAWEELGKRMRRSDRYNRHED